jgi:preprotein translocase subunit YajC
MAPPAEGQEGGGLMSFLPLILIMVVFYFFFIRPQMKKAKDQRKFREALKKGDKVITIGGIHGKILSVDDSTVMLEVEGGNKLQIEKSAIISDSAQVGLAK